jgi:pimeloyl-ACP methyl ester carboxylesterase
MSAPATVDFASTAQVVRVRDHDLHLNVVGDGPVLLMLHGSGPGASSWSNFRGNIPQLARHFRVIAVDQPGFGHSSRLDYSRGSFFAQTSALLGELLSSMGAEQVSVLGNSLGGGTALRVALDHPDLVDRLVLMGPGGAAVPIFSLPVSEGLRQLNEFYQDPGPSKGKLVQFLRTMVYDAARITPELVEERWAVASNPENFAAAREWLASLARTPEQDQLWRYLHKVHHQTLMIWGRDDRTIPLDSAFFALRRIPNARLHVFPRCGHWAQVECETEFNRLVIDFLTA